MTNTSTFASKTQSRPSHWIPPDTTYTRSWMGGCPHAQTLMAWSGLLQAEVCISIPCKRWGCHHCGVVRAADLSRRIVEAAPTKFITLTVANALFTSPRNAYDETRRRLPKWSSMVRREVGDFEYVRVLEVTKAGFPHYHLLARCGYISQSTISRFWAGLTGAPLVDIRAIRPGQNSINYCCKYLRKQNYCSFTTRRVSWTRNFFVPTPQGKRDLWKLTNKEHSRNHPAEQILQEWGRVIVTKIGPYAYVRNSDLDEDHPLKEIQ